MIWAIFENGTERNNKITEMEAEGWTVFRQYLDTFYNSVVVIFQKILESE